MVFRGVDLTSIGTATPSGEAACDQEADSYGELVEIRCPSCTVRCFSRGAFFLRRVAASRV